MDLETLSAKLLGWILSQNPIEGPETISILDAILAPKRLDSRPERYNSERTERVRPDAFGSYPKKNFIHPDEPKKAKKDINRAKISLQF